MAAHHHPFLGPEAADVLGLALWPFGRDIVQMGRGQRSAYDVRHHVYQPGETIVEATRPLRYVHVVVEGQAEVLRDGEVTLTIGPGGHFGRKWLEQHGADAVRSRTLVRTLVLRADQANVLQDLLLSSEPLIAKTMLRPALVEEPRERP